MSRVETLIAAGGALALVLLGLVVLALVTVARLRREVAALRAEREPRTTPADAATPVTQEALEETTWVITGIDEEVASAPVEVTPVAGRIEGRLFADIVARETAVRAGGLAHGLRRALAPEVRNRIRFEMRREVKRSRKQRRADRKAALRDLHARQRADVDTSPRDAGAHDPSADDGNAA